MKTYIYLFIVIIFTGCIHNKNEFKVSDLKFETEDLDTTLCKKYSLGATNKYDLLQKRFSNNIFLTKDKCYVNYFNLSFLKKGHFKKIKVTIQSDVNV